MCGDNISLCHKMKTLEDAPDVVIGYCIKCKQRYYCRKVDGRVEPKYGKIYRRDTLQPGQNLYYREYPHKMNIV